MTAQKKITIYFDTKRLKNNPYFVTKYIIFALTL